MLYQILSASFCVIVVISNIISAKMISLPFIEIPAGLITYPLTFLLSDLVTEIYGARNSKQMVYTALGMNLLAFFIIKMALLLPSSGDGAFEMVLGLSGLRIFSSLVAYLVSQIVDIQIYAWIKSLTGERLLWLRNNGSTCLSQAIDTLIIDILYLYLGLEMGLTEVLPIMFFSFIYKAFFSFAVTPLFYICVYGVKKIQHKVIFEQS